jgi:hypothetical protein
MPSPIERYRCDLVDALRWRPALARRVLIEVTDHLIDAAATHRGAGLPDEAAELAAIRQLGPARQLAGQYRGAGLTLGLLLAAGAGATALIALWLLFVTTFILPARHPTEAAVWRMIAGLFGGYSIVSVLLLDAPGRRRLRSLTAGLSVAAIAFGGYAAVMTLRIWSVGGQDPEGYLLLMGVLITVHGVVALTFALLSARVPTTKTGAA